MIEQDFVEERQNFMKNQNRTPESLDMGMIPTPEYLHYQITMARLLALSFGESTISRERWDYMKHLEYARLNRLREFPVSTSIGSTSSSSFIQTLHPSPPLSSSSIDSSKTSSQVTGR